MGKKTERTRNQISNHHEPGIKPANVSSLENSNYGY